MFRIGLPETLVLLTIGCFMLIGAAIMIVPYWKIYSRTGQPGAMALLQLIPLVNIVMLYVLAFSEWPIEREMNARKNNPV